MKSEVILISKTKINEWFTYTDYFEAMKQAFAYYASGKHVKPNLMHIDVSQGEFHIKSGGIIEDKTYFAIKSNGGFFNNQQNYGYPNIIGLITLFNGDNGMPLAIMDSTEITSKRTAATSALAAKYLAKPNPKRLLICGTGNQSKHQMLAMLEIHPTLEEVYVWGNCYKTAVNYANEMSFIVGKEIMVLKDLEDLKCEALYLDIIVTCTSSKSFFLKEDMIKKGTFISAVGADSPDKQELDPVLLGKSRIFVDVLEQCIKVGELHHAILEGTLKDLEKVTSLGDVILGTADYHYDENAITIFDTTGFAVQDTSAALMVYRKALENEDCFLFDPYK